jgi:hypothetical protein
VTALTVEVSIVSTWLDITPLNIWGDVGRELLSSALRLRKRNLRARLLGVVERFDFEVTVVEDVAELIDTVETDHERVGPTSPTPLFVKEVSAVVGEVVGDRESETELIESSVGVSETALKEPGLLSDEGPALRLESKYIQES